MVCDVEWKWESEERDGGRAEVPEMVNVGDQVVEMGRSLRELGVVHQCLVSSPGRNCSRAILNVVQNMCHLPSEHAPLTQVTTHTCWPSLHSIFTFLHQRLCFSLSSSPPYQSLFLDFTATLMGGRVGLH